MNNDPFTLKLCINDYIANFELDTGSFVSTIRRVDVIKAGGTIIPTAEMAMAYGGARINFCGETKLNVRYNNSTKSHTFLVVDCKEVNLFGRDLCKLFNVQISLPNSDIRIHNTKQILLEKHTDYLADNYEPCVEETVSLNVLPNSRPIFSKARSVPVRMKDKVKEELDRLVHCTTR